MLSNNRHDANADTTLLGFLSIHKCYYQKTVLVSNLYTHVIA